MFKNRFVKNLMQIMRITLIFICNYC